MNIIQSSLLMKSKPSKKSKLETECLYGESVEIFEETRNWAFCKLITDNYFGWVMKKGLGILEKATHRVIVNRTFIFENKSSKSNCYMYLPLGANLTVEKFERDWVKTSLYFNKKKYCGYVPSKHLVSLSHKNNDWVSVAQHLIGTPYKWGGRDTLGLDCSALLQLSYQTYGEVLPRNTSEQIKLPKREIKNIDSLGRGCVVFWEGHVGIMIDRLNCIHANGFHMKTEIEPLKQIIKRMNKNFKILKMMDFN